MAKVSGPLMSMDASGKIGDAIVFSKWKGQNYVRQWLKPANPQTADQGDTRVRVGGTGKACGKVSVLGVINEKLQALGVIPSGQSKQSYLVKYILMNYLTNATTYAEQLAALTGHTAYTAFQAAADTLGISAFDLAYASVAAYDKGLGVFLLAKTCQALQFTGEPYTTALSAWTGADIDLFVADF